MQIRGTVAGDFQFHGAKKYGETGTRMARLTLQVKVKEDEAKNKFGADFYRVAFGAMQSKEGFASFPYGVLQKPNLMLEVHDVEIFGTKVRVSAEIPKITAVEDEPAVVMSLVLPVEVNELRKQWFGELTCNSGDVINVEFDPVQMELPGVDEDKGMRVKRKDGRWGNPTPMLVEA